MATYCHLFNVIFCRIQAYDSCSYVRTQEFIKTYVFIAFVSYISPITNVFNSNMLIFIVNIFLSIADFIHFVVLFFVQEYCIVL